MNKLIIALIVGFVVWQGYSRYQDHLFEIASSSNIPEPDRSTSYDSSEEKNRFSNFKCDGRTYCSQMTSCEEATFFLKNCPNVKMDGNNDGVPCEKQWCR